MKGNKFATGQILEKPVEVVKGRILAGWAQKCPKLCMSLGAWLSSYSATMVFGGGVYIAYVSQMFHVGP